MQTLSEMNFDVSVKKHGDKFFFLIPELGVLVEDTDLQNGYNQIEIKKNEYIQVMKDINSEHIIVNEVMLKRLQKDRIKGFSKKTFLTVCFVGILSFSLTGIFMGVKINKSINKVMTKIDLNIDKAIHPDPQKLPRRVKKFGLFAKHLGLYINEIKHVWDNPPALEKKDE